MERPLTLVYKRPLRSPSCSTVRVSSPAAHAGSLSDSVAAPIKRSGCCVTIAAISSFAWRASSWAVEGSNNSSSDGDGVQMTCMSMPAASINSVSGVLARDLNPIGRYSDADNDQRDG
jgi:hypothetical protein